VIRNQLSQCSHSVATLPCVRRQRVSPWRHRWRHRRRRRLAAHLSGDHKRQTRAAYGRSS